MKDDKGKVAHWVGETGSPSALVLIGWSKTCVVPGDVISVYIYPLQIGYPCPAVLIVSFSPMEAPYMMRGLAELGEKSRYNPTWRLE